MSLGSSSSRMDLSTVAMRICKFLITSPVNVWFALIDLSVIGTRMTFTQMKRTWSYSVL